MLKTTSDADKFDHGGHITVTEVKFSFIVNDGGVLELNSLNFKCETQ